MAEMFPRLPEPAPVPQKQTTAFLLEKAKLSFQSEKKIEAFEFSPAVRVSHLAFDDEEVNLRSVVMRETQQY